MKRAGNAMVAILVVLIVLVTALAAPEGLAVAGLHLELAPPSIARAAPDDDMASGERAPAARAVPESLPAATVAELALLDLTNAERVREGLSPVHSDLAVLGLARMRAEAQLTRDALSHYDAAGRPIIAGLLAEAGVGYRLAGENLARWVATDPAAPERVQQALMGSPSHRGNILEPSFDRLAVGAASDASGRIAFAQIFREAP